MSGIIPKGQWHWQKAGKGRANEGKAFASYWGIRRVDCGERLIPSSEGEPSWFWRFLPPFFFSSGSRWDLVKSRFPDRRNDPTPAHHIERQYHPRSITADLVI